MNDTDHTHGKTPLETSHQVAKTFFGVKDRASRQEAIRSSLISVVWITLLVPSIFYLRFREVGPLGWGTTVFFDVYCLLSAIGLYFGTRAEYHSPVPLHGNWLDRVGAFWLVACVFGPFFGWIVTTGVFPITQASWHWLYGLRVFFAAGIPVLTALPLTRYVRGKSVRVALPLLLCVTLLPVLSAMNVSRDLWDGTVVRQLRATCQPELYLKHTGRSLGVCR